MRDMIGTRARHWLVEEEMRGAPRIVVGAGYTCRFVENLLPPLRQYMHSIRLLIRRGDIPFFLFLTLGTAHHGAYNLMFCCGPICNASVQCDSVTHATS